MQMRQGKKHRTGEDNFPRGEGQEWERAGGRECKSFGLQRAEFLDQRGAVVVEIVDGREWRDHEGSEDDLLGDGGEEKVAPDDDVAVLCAVAVME